MLKRFLLKLAFAAMALLAAAAGFALALIFIFVAAYNALLLVMPGWGAALIIAGAAILASVLLIMTARLLLKPSRPKPRPRETEGMEAVFSSLLGENARGFAEKNAFVASLLALVAGFAAGLSPRLREMVFKFLSV